MHGIEQLQRTFFSWVTGEYKLIESQLNRCSFDINTEALKSAFGDVTTNTAMMLAKEVGLPPRTIAQHLADNFTHPIVKKIEVAGPGFLNFFITDRGLLEIAQQLLEQKSNFFKPDIQPKKINIEFVSANPTGPLHFGHGRNGILGDTLANILTFIGHDVTREFYINDAGSQITKLGASLKTRYLQACGHDVELAQDAYHGNYLVELGNKIAHEHGTAYVDYDSTYFSAVAQDAMLAEQQATLAAYGIRFDIWFSEQALKNRIDIAAYIQKLTDNGYTYERDGALWFATTQFGDDKDRVLQKSDGQYTYLAGDLPYLVDKLERGYDKLIMILGQDHHSFVIRLHALMQALGYKPEKLTVILYQLVHIVENGESARMSKRAGTIVDLHDIIKTVGKDVARFFYLNKKADAELEFDLELALSTTNDNPVFYIQYAYVRTCSILQKALVTRPDLLDLHADDIKTLSDQEKMLVKKMTALKSILRAIDSSYQTQLIAYYTYELAQLFHGYYNSTKALVDDTAQTRHNLCMIIMVQQTLKLCFDLMGISSPQNM